MLRTRVYPALFLSSCGLTSLNKCGLFAVERATVVVGCKDISMESALKEARTTAEAAIGW